MFIFDGHDSIPGAVVTIAVVAYHGRLSASTQLTSNNRRIEAEQMNLQKPQYCAHSDVFCNTCIESRHVASANDAVGDHHRHKVLEGI